MRDERMGRSLLVSAMIHAALILLLMGVAGGGSGDGDGSQKQAGRYDDAVNVEIVSPPNDEGVPASKDPGIGESKKIADSECEQFFGGIGINQEMDWAYNPPKLIIVKVHPGYPAEQAGLLEGEEIVSRNQIRGEIGTDVQITIRRAGTQLTVSMTRAKICTTKKEENP